MKKTKELRDKLAETFSKRQNWNKRVEINGETFIYISATNEVRMEVKQPSGTIAALVGCFSMAYGNGKFMWCC